MWWRSKGEKSPFTPSNTNYKSHLLLKSLLSFKGKGRRGFVTRHNNSRTTEGGRLGPHKFCHRGPNMKFLVSLKFLFIYYYLLTVFLPSVEMSDSLVLFFFLVDNSVDKEETYIMASYKVVSFTYPFL